VVILRINLFIILKGGEKMKKIMTALLLAMPSLVSAQSINSENEEAVTAGQFGLDELNTDLRQRRLKRYYRSIDQCGVGLLRYYRRLDHLIRWF
jgi:hypothetical protein